MSDEARDDLREEIRDLIRRGELDEAGRRLASAGGEVSTAVLAELSEDESTALLQRIPAEVSADVIEHLHPETAADLLEEIKDESASDILDELEVDEAVPVLEAMEPDRAAAVVEDMVEPDVRAMLESYAEGTAGRLMTPDPFHVLSSQTAAEAIAAVRAAGTGSDIITYLYVVDRQRHLLGVAGLRDVILAPAQTPVGEVMHAQPVAVNVATAEEECVRLFLRHRFMGLPVVDGQARLVGVIRADRLMRQADEEAAEDMLGMFLARDVAEESVVRVASHRLPWLVINLGTAAAAATVIGAFQGTIEAFVALTVFLPVIGGMGGNAGTQTLAVLVRMLAMGRVSRRGRLRVLWDELSIGLIKGLIIGFLIGVVAGIWQQSVGFGVVVGGAMLGNMLAAGLVGTAVPMVLQRLRLDPAIGSGVLVTVATDVIGFTLLLGLATLLLNGLR